MRPVFNSFANTMTASRSTSLRWSALGLCCALAGALPPAAQAHGRAHGRAERGGSASELSAASLVPVALSVALPLAVLSVAGIYTVKAVELSAQGSVWVLERASDGARISVTVASEAAAGALLAAGATVTALACSAGWVLHTAGKAIAIVPNAVGQTLMYNERVTR